MTRRNTLVPLLNCILVSKEVPRMGWLFVSCLPRRPVLHTRDSFLLAGEVALGHGACRRSCTAMQNSCPFSVGGFSHTNGCEEGASVMPAKVLETCLVHESKNVSCLPARPCTPSVAKAVALFISNLQRLLSLI